MKNLSPLAIFCSRHKISRTMLSEIAGGDANDASKSTMQRLLHDELTDAGYATRLRKVLAQNLPAYLFNLGLSAAEIDHQLLSIFDKGEYQPMITQRTVLPKKVYEFFGFSADPFAKSPESREQVFTSPALKEVNDQIIDAIKFQGFKSVSGEIGSGKTVLRSLVEDYVGNSDNLRLIFPETFDMQRVTPANVSRAILEEFESSHIPNDAVSRAKKVKNVLAQAHKKGIRVAIAFDECHRLSDNSISSLKNFLEMNSGGFQKYLGVILFGQPSFETRLSEPKFREIFERITQIKMPIFQDSAIAYLAHRLKLVGGDVAELFDTAALELISRQSQTPLQLGNIVNTAFIHSKNDFNEKKVIGAAIKTKMMFSESKEPKELSKGKGAR